MHPALRIAFAASTTTSGVAAHAAPASSASCAASSAAIPRRRQRQTRQVRTFRGSGMEVGRRLGASPRDFQAKSTMAEPPSRVGASWSRLRSVTTPDRAANHFAAGGHKECDAACAILCPVRRTPDTHLRFFVPVMRCWKFVRPLEKSNEVDPLAKHSGHRRSRRGRARRQRRSIALAIGVAAAIAVIWLVVATTLHRQGPSNAGQSERAAGGQMRAVDSWPYARPKLHTRRIYPHSIVPGGVHTAEEVSTAKAVDPVVAAHYATVDPSRLRVERLAQPLAAHVSYRIGDKIYWTEGKVQLAAGEQVLTDGKTTLRARCGNIVSTVRRTPIFAGEPEEAEFELVVEPVVLASVRQVLILHKGSAWARARKPHPAAVTNPGPSTLVLLAFGVAASVARYQYRRRANQ